jgi:sortase A
MTKSSATPRNKFRRALELFLLFAGVAGVGIWGWSLVHESLYQGWSNWAFDRGISGERVSLADYLHHLKAKWTGNPDAPIAGTNSGNGTAPATPVNNETVGRLDIPRLHVQAVVREGTSEATLDVALGHVAGTALPGQNGNVAVAGHRDRLFRGLKNISPGDRIEFETGRGKFIYQVEDTRIVKPEDVGVLKAGTYPELTLVTCYPFRYIGSAPDRFIVKARQVQQVAIAQPASEALPSPARNIHPGRIPFDIGNNHSRQLTKGISIGLTATDPAGKTAEGWMWVMPDRRTIWLRSLHVNEPLVFYPESDGRRRELVLTAVSEHSARGYLVTRMSAPSTSGFQTEQ